MFGIWYRSPFDELVGGRDLFLILMSVDVVCGPLLTLIAFDRTKTKLKFWGDIVVIAVLQIAALVYGVHTVFEARPVLVAYEGGRFRLVTSAEIDHDRLEEAPSALRTLPVDGPRLIGVRLLAGDEAGYLESLKEALAGNPPAFRPSRWKPYESTARGVCESARPVANLLTNRPPSSRVAVEIKLQTLGLKPAEVGFLPFVATRHDDWIVLIDRGTCMPVGYVHVDGFL